MDDRRMSNGIEALAHPDAGDYQAIDSKADKAHRPAIGGKDCRGASDSPLRAPSKHEVARHRRLRQMAVAVEVPLQLGHVRFTWFDPPDLSRGPPDRRTVVVILNNQPASLPTERLGQKHRL
jgi:hypothetical protein